MIDAIQRTSTDKAPGPVQIPNRSWKNVAEVVAKPLAKSVHRCLEISYCLKHFWDSITLASTIRKERSPDYHSVGAYRSIALLNTIGKLLERIVADRLADMLEILPEFQMGARRKRSAVSALQVATLDGSNIDNRGREKWQQC